MNKYERSYSLLSLALGLAEANDFKVVGEEGKKNYQLLFSKFIRMVEDDKNDFFLKHEKKLTVISSLKRTIAFYDASDPRELQQIIMNMKKNDSTEFMVLPAYVTRKSMDHVFGLILYRKEDQFMVIMVDKLKHMNDHHFTGTVTMIPLKNLAPLSKILFESKLDHHKESRCNIAKFIYQLGEGENGYEGLHLNMGGYDGALANCPIKEIFGTLRVALYNCREPILQNTKDHFHPKLGSTKKSRELFIRALIKDKQEFSREQVSELTYLFKVYLELKAERKNMAKKNPIRGTTYSKGKIALEFIQKSLINASNSPDTFKKSFKNPKAFRVFSTDNKNLEKLENALNEIIMAVKSEKALDNKRKLSCLTESACKYVNEENNSKKIKKESTTKEVLR